MTKRMKLAILAAATIIALPAMAQDRGAWFKSLKQPTTGSSCCDLADCKVVSSRVETGPDKWFALLPEGELQIPEDRVLKNKPNPTEGAVLCRAPSGTIYCFVPPDMGT